jgi:hypothetical protein
MRHQVGRLKSPLYGVERGFRGEEVRANLDFSAHKFSKDNISWMGTPF